MVTRSLNNEEMQSFNWSLYPFEVSAGTIKENIISFTQSKMIKTKELAFEEYPIYIDTLTTDIIIIDNKGQKQFARYNHIYKGNIIKIEINDKWINWSQAKKNIKKIIFMDNLIYHLSVRNLWNEKGFSFTKFYLEGIGDELKNNILLTA